MEWNPAQGWAFRKVYRYLSYVAHGTPPSLVENYGRGIISAHDDRQVPEILLVGCSYALLGATVWNEVYRLIPDGPLQELAEGVTARSRRGNSPDDQSEQ
jgi:hypothetical protein